MSVLHTALCLSTPQTKPLSSSKTDTISLRTVPSEMYITYEKLKCAVEISEECLFLRIVGSESLLMRFNLLFQ